MHPAAREGILLIEEGAYFEAHEALETAWRETPPPGRELYQGILQAAVTYLHLQRGNREGALKVYQRASGISGPGCHAAKEPTWKSCWDTWLRCYPPNFCRAHSICSPARVAHPICTSLPVR